MRIFFVLSASLWAWLVGRAITFGPNTRGLCWHPNMHADSWYRLTPNPYNIPHKYFPVLSFVFAALAVPALFVQNDIIHIATVLKLVSEHAYIPMFVAHIHSDILLAVWTIFNILASVGCILLFNIEQSTWAIIAIIPTTIATALHAWFLAIELYIVFKQAPVRQEQVYEARHPRII
jgi:hypothetical protein